jgi:hypothetical protein
MYSWSWANLNENNIDILQKISIKTRCRTIFNRIFATLIFEGRLTGRLSINFLQKELPSLIEEIPVVTRLGAYLQHDGVQHTSSYSWHFLHDTYPGLRISGSETLNWPSRSYDVILVNVLSFRTFEVFGRRREEDQLRITSSHRSGRCRASTIQPELFQELRSEPRLIEHRTSVRVNLSCKYNVLRLCRFAYKHLWELRNNTALSLDIRTPRDSATSASRTQNCLY